MSNSDLKLVKSKIESIELILCKFIPLFDNIQESFNQVSKERTDFLKTFLPVAIKETLQILPKCPCQSKKSADQSTQTECSFFTSAAKSSQTSMPCKKEKFAQTDRKGRNQSIQTESPPMDLNQLGKKPPNANAKPAASTIATEAATEELPSLKELPNTNPENMPIKKRKRRRLVGVKSPLRFVIRGVPKTINASTIQDELTKLDIKVSSCRRMISRASNKPLKLLEVKLEAEDQKFVGLTQIADLSVQIEEFIVPHESMREPVKKIMPHSAVIPVELYAKLLSKLLNN